MHQIIRIVIFFASPNDLKLEGDKIPNGLNKSTIPSSVHAAGHILVYVVRRKPARTISEAPCPGEAHYAIRVVKSIKGILFPGRKPLFNRVLVAYVDADWGGFHETRRSTTEFIVTINSAPIFWRY